MRWGVNILGLLVRTTSFLFLSDQESMYAVNQRFTAYYNYSQGKFYNP